MSQYDFSIINPATKSGTDLATDLNNFRDALNSCHKGNSRPSYAISGMTWINDTTTPWVFNIYDGTDDIPIGTINIATNLFSLPSTAQELIITTGSANAYLATLSPAPTAYSVGLTVRCQFNIVNTDASTINVNSLGVKNIKHQDGSALSDGDLVGIFILVYDGINFVLILNNVTMSQAEAEAGTSTAIRKVTAQRMAQAIAALGQSGSPKTRNCVLNQDPVTQGTSTRTGMSSTIYEGNGTSQSIDADVDMATGDLGGLTIAKNRDQADTWIWTDTVRTAGETLTSETTAAEITDADTITAFESTGVAIGADLKINTNTEKYVLYSFQTNQKTTGTTNHNKAYTCHYNDNMGFSIVGYEGDGVDGHEIPHHLGKVPELSIFKNRDGIENWTIQSPLFAYEEYLLFTTIALASVSTRNTLFNDVTVQIGSDSYNTSADNIISYHFTSVPGVSKIGKYIGTGAAGNYVDCGFGAKKAAFVMIKNLTTAQSWVIEDNIRGNFALRPNTSDVETASTQVDFVNGGIVLRDNAAMWNELNSEYIFLAFAETDIDSTKAWSDYDYPTTADTLSIIENTLLSFAEGFDANGQLDTQELVGAGITHQITGKPNQHLWLYKDKAGSYGTTENRPLEGITRDDADKWGIESPLDPTLRTTAKHFDYESETGVALASGELATVESWNAFNKLVYTDSRWTITSTTTSWLQYKQHEKRILKSWRIRTEDTTTARDPKRFTIEGSNDGYSWTAIDSTYTSADYTGNGVSLWGNLHSTSGNTTAYLYHRINITLNNGDGTYTSIGEMEFNTILPSDYFLVNEGLMYNSSDAEIDRIYLAELMTNDDSEISWYRNLAVAKMKGEDTELQGDLIVHKEIKNNGIVTAWAIVDETQNPPLILDSYNIVDVIDVGGIAIHYVVDDSIDLNHATIPNSVETTLDNKHRFIITSAGIARRSITVVGGK